MKSPAHGLLLDWLAAGRVSPRAWDEAVRQFADSRSSIERTSCGIARACRLMNGYYPPSVRRAWACEDAALSSKALHALRLIEFELGFTSGSSSHGTGHPEKLLDRIAEYLRLGRNGRWLWETLVEFVAEELKLKAGGNERMARWAACRALRAYYPYGSKLNGPALWKSIDLPVDSRHVLELIEFEFDFASTHASPGEFEAELATAQMFGEALPELVRSRCFSILRPPSLVHLRDHVPGCAGVYALYREADDSLPTYIGEAINISDRLKCHELEWGRQIHLNYFPDDRRKKTEAILHGVVCPTANNFIRVPDPDELAGLFV